MQVFNNVGAEGLYTVSRGALAIAFDAGVYAINFDAGFFDAKLGAKLRLIRGTLSFSASPSVLLALTERDGTPENKDALFVPVVATLKLGAGLSFGFGSGIKGPLADLADAWEIPLGAIGTYVVSPRLGFGASWVFGKLIGGADDPPDPAPPATGFRYRAIQLWASYTM